ncbi:3557_t:CDS:2, partial [Cetraspora pellucida]
QVLGECYCYYNDKNIPKKFLAKNNMDPEDIPEELQDLTKIKEMLITQIFTVHYIAATVDYNNVESFRIIIIGTARTEKSYLIKVVVAWLNELAKDHDVEKKLPVLLLAPTGVTAYNIHKITIYLALFILVNCTNFNLNSEHLKQLQNKLQDQQDQLFGNQSVILNSDFEQLSPVLDNPIYTSTLQHDSLSNNSIIVYKQFLEVYKLDVVQCQSGNLEDQCYFKNILLCLHDEKSTIDNWKTLITQLADLPRVDNTLNCFVARINAHYAMGGHKASKANFNTAKAKLVNRLIEVIQEILFKKDKASSCLLSILLVEFEDYSGPSILTIKNKRLAITVYKSQGLMLAKSKIDLREREYAVGLSFMAVSQVCTLKDLLFCSFSLKRLQCIKKFKRLQERKTEEK